MSAFLLRLLPTLALTAVLLRAAPAAAYQCTPVTDGEGRVVSPAVSQVWNQRCLPYFLQRGNNLFSGEAQRLLVSQSFSVWENNTCTDLDFVDLGYTSNGPGFDSNKSGNENVITAIENASELGAYFPEPNMVAITVTAFSTLSGEIFDADVVVNASSFEFTDVADENACRAMSNPPFDLRAILIHEIGHFIGFDHEDDTESTMFFSAPTCETKKRTLTDDDILGLCTVYATAQPPATCAAPSTAYDEVAGASSFRQQCERRLSSASGCTCANPTTIGSWWALLAAGALLALRKRQ